VNKLRITDPFTEKLGLYVHEEDEKHLVIGYKGRTEHLNPYGFAHGGFLYAIGHIAARNMAKHCLNRDMQVVQATCQYLATVTATPILASAKLLSDIGTGIVCQVRVLDGNNNVCFLQTLVMNDTVDDGVERQQPKVYKGPTGGKYDTGHQMFNAKGTFFDDLCRIGAPYADAKGIHVSTDLYTDNRSDAWYVHQGVIFTLCDNCAAACVAMMQQKRPVTVSATIHYLRPATVGPIVATGTLLRGGNKLAYYNIDVRDGNGKKVATSQYIMNCTDWPNMKRK